MSFPISPTNGQQITLNGITYTYASATRSWRRNTLSNVSADYGTFSGNVTANNYIISGTGIFYSNGTAYSSGGGGITYTANTAPPTSGNVSGDQWYNTSTDALFEYQFDGTSYYWIDITSPSIGDSQANISVLAVTDGGTGATTAADARTNLGLEIGTDIQAYSSNFLTLSAYGTGTGNSQYVQRDSSARIPIGTNWSVFESSTVLYFRSGSTNLAEIDTSGNVTGNYFIGNGSQLTGVTSVNLLAISSNIIPSANATYNLGSTTNRWLNVYTSDLDLSNQFGSWTIVEGEDDLFLYNNKKNKVYKFVLQEVDPTIAPPKARSE
jgi:hypothetical protein